MGFGSDPFPFFDQWITDIVLLYTGTDAEMKYRFLIDDFDPHEIAGRITLEGQTV